MFERAGLLAGGFEGRAEEAVCAFSVGAVAKMNQGMCEFNSVVAKRNLGGKKVSGVRIESLLNSTVSRCAASDRRSLTAKRENPLLWILPIPLKVQL